MAERGGARGRGGGGGRGRRGGAPSSISLMAQRLGTTTLALRQMKTQFDPEPTFPKFLVPRPTKLNREEMAMVKYYKSVRNKILEETPFYVAGVKRTRAEVDEEDDGIVRYRDKYKPAKVHRQTLRGLPIEESFFPDELKHVLQGTGTTGVKRHIKKYNLDDFLEVANEEDLPDPTPTEDEPTGPNRADIIRNDEDDELEQPGAADPDADEDLEEDDYGEDYFDNGEGDFDDYADVGDEDER